MKEGTTEVKYVYRLKPAKVVAKYVDEEGKELEKTETTEGKVRDPYTTNIKEIADYELIEVPENKEGTMTEEQITVKYVYRLKPAKVVAKYVDEEGNELEIPETTEGKLKDSYTTKEKEIYGYELIEVPENKEGTMTEEQITVKYVYRLKPAKVVAKYVDEEGNELEIPETTEGKLKDSYTTKEKEIYGYELIEVPENKEGTMKEGTTEVKYVYRLKPAKVVAKYVDEEGKELEIPETTEGKVFEAYDTIEKEIPGYELIKIPSNKKGKLKEEEIEVEYKYKKLPFDMEVKKYITKIVQNEKEINTNEKNNQLIKVEVKGNKINSEKIKIYYTIKVKNNGKIAGKIEKIVDYIPSGLEFNAEDNEHYWKKTNSVIETEILKDKVLQPGEEIELKVVLRWKNNENNTGTIENIAKIENLYNEYNYKDINLKNNESNANVIISIKTGIETTINLLMPIVIVSGIALAIYVTKRKLNK